MTLLPDAPAPAPRRPARPQHVFAVQRTEQLSPHLVRVHLGGPAFADFVAGGADQLACTDAYVKLLMVRPGLDLQPPYDLDALRAELPPEDLPVRRTYTVRAVDHDAGTIAIDFVVHGDEGIAGPWAANARPGDLLALNGPGGMYAPADDADVTHLILGDDAALPAISAAVAALPPHARGSVIIEVHDTADQLDLVVPDGVELRWLHRADGDADSTPAGYGRPLVDAVAGLARVEGRVQVFAHGERTAMKRIREILHDGWGIDRADLSLSAYWAFGRAEDTFQAEKREPVGQIFADAGGGLRPALRPARRLAGRRWLSHPTSGP